jgi:hypothetical protein
MVGIGLGIAGAATMRLPVGAVLMMEMLLETDGE